MPRRRLLPLATALALTTLGSIAHATTAILPSGTALPLEQRVAIAVSPSRTTVWTNLRLDTGAGSVGLLIPVPPGAALDHSSDAWLEALDDATAVRVFPPTGAAYVCPGTNPDPNADPFHTTTFPTPMAGLGPAESTVLPDVPAVLAWASTHGFTVPPATIAALDAMPGMRFFVERFDPKAAPPFFTSTVRVVLPTSTPVLPLTLSRADSSDLRITAWFIGAGRASLTGSSPLTLQTSSLQWLAASQTSNYIDLRDAALVAAGTTASITESASHDALLKNVAIANGKGAITGVVTGYFQRAATYGDSGADTNACILNASASLESSSLVTKSCPRADLGVVDGVPACTETPGGGEIDPAKLRCGGRADDLAVALSDLQPLSTWLTRMTMVVPKNSSGQTWPITFAAGTPTADPITNAASITFANCSSMSTSSGTSTGSGNGSSSTGGPWTTSSGSGNNPPPTTTDPGYDSDMACGCGGPAAPVIIDNTGGYGGDAYGGGGNGGDAYYDSSTSDDCDGSTTDSSTSDTSSSDDCDGSTTDSSTSDTSSSDDCDGSTTDSSTSDTSSSDDCDGSTSTSDTSSSSGSSSSSSDGIDCSSDTSGGGGSSETSSSSSDSSDCTVARQPRAKPSKRGPKASVLTLGLLAILAPLRRLTRPRRTSNQPKDKLRVGRAG